MLDLALIGAGRMGRTHARALERSGETRLVAVCDLDPDAARAAYPPGARAVSDIDEVLADRSIDGVLIAAPTPLHDTLVERALVAGKHVLCEKPLTLEVRRDIALGRLAEDLGLVLQIGFWRRFAWPYREASRLLAAGAIGVPRLMRASQWDSAPPAPEFCDPAMSGGIEIDCGVHELDLAAWLLGSPIARVSASGTPGDPAIEAVGDVEALAALAVTASGTPVTIDLARSVRYGDDVRTEIAGAAGALLVSGVGTGSLAVGSPAGLEGMPPATDDVLEDALARQADVFAQAIGGHRDAALPGSRESARALAAAQAMRRARLNRDVEDVTLAG
jgi:myo-inositol 2-dehydrogenase/D-chiro-inositol 1-dehydrogenase